MTDENRFTDSNTDITDESSTPKETKLGEKAWFVVNTYSTHEKKVAVNLERRVESMGIQDLVFRIIVAEQEVPVMDRETNLPTGKTRMKNLFIFYPPFLKVSPSFRGDGWRFRLRRELSPIQAYSRPWRVRGP